MYSAHRECSRAVRLPPCILAGFDLHPWHPQRERFGAGNERRAVTTIVGRDYSTIALMAEHVVSRLNTKNDDVTPPHAR